MKGFHDIGWQFLRNVGNDKKRGCKKSEVAPGFCKICAPLFFVLCAINKEKEQIPGGEEKSYVF
jgi:hypothetical protein